MRTRYKMLTQIDKSTQEELIREAQQDAKARWTLYEQMAAIHYDADGNGEQKK